jgi:hypothetical protein
MVTLCLDLEETIIDNIWDGNILTENIQKIKKIIKHHKPDRIITFSFALIDAQDKQIWKHVQSELKEMGITVETQQFEVNELRQLFLRKRFGAHRLPDKDSTEFLCEFTQFCRKDIVFEWWAMQQAEGNFILVDDMVENKTIVCGKRAIKLIKI